MAVRPRWPYEEDKILALIRYCADKLKAQAFRDRFADENAALVPGGLRRPGGICFLGQSDIGRDTGMHIHLVTQQNR